AARRGKCILRHRHSRLHSHGPHGSGEDCRVVSASWPTHWTLALRPLVDGIKHSRWQVREEFLRLRAGGARCQEAREIGETERASPKLGAELIDGPRGGEAARRRSGMPFGRG